MYRNKPVTKNDVANYYEVNLSSVEQIDSKQLFVVGVNLISYLTVVGRYNPDIQAWELTDYNYSVTTSRQLTQFKRLNHIRAITIKKQFENILK